MTAPENLKYAGTHEWARLEADGAVTVGITFHAQKQLVDVVFVQPPAAGRKVKQGEACAVIEPVKAASDIHAPVSGEVIAANPEVSDKPERINQDPYAAWLFRIRPDRPAELNALLDAAAYLKLAEQEKT